MKIQFFAVPIGDPAAFAMLFRGIVGSRKYPPTAEAMWRKNTRRLVCGNFQNCVPRVLLQSFPNRSFIGSLVAKQEIQLVDRRPA